MGEKHGNWGSWVGRWAGDDDLVVLLCSLHTCSMCSFLYTNCYKITLKIGWRGSQRCSFVPSVPYSDLSGGRKLCLPSAWTPSPPPPPLWPKDLEECATPIPISSPPAHWLCPLPSPCPITPRVSKCNGHLPFGSDTTSQQRLPRLTPACFLSKHLGCFLS